MGGGERRRQENEAVPANPATTTAALLRERAGNKTTGNKARDSDHMSGWYFKKNNRGRRTTNNKSHVRKAEESAKGARGTDQLHQGGQLPGRRGERCRRSQISLLLGRGSYLTGTTREDPPYLCYGCCSHPGSLRLSAKARWAKRRRRSSGRGAGEGLKSIIVPS